MGFRDLYFIFFQFIHDAACSSFLLLDNSILESILILLLFALISYFLFTFPQFCYEVSAQHRSAENIRNYKTSYTDSQAAPKSPIPESSTSPRSEKTPNKPLNNKNGNREQSGCSSCVGCLFLPFVPLMILFPPLLFFFLIAGFISSIKTKK